MPVWWPFSYYNVRYGLELAPAFAIFAALAIYFMAVLARSRGLRLALAVAGLVFVAASYASIWRDPVCFREALVNSRTRVALERELADFVKALPPDSTLLMYLGNHVGALQQAGIPLRRVINEGNHRTWKQPVDREGLWERTLANPVRYADFVIAFEGDPVSTGVQQQDLFPLAVIHVSGQPKATIYQTHLPR
jgi:predicted outer membrane lipoprotein